MQEAAEAPSPLSYCRAWRPVVVPTVGASLRSLFRPRQVSGASLCLACLYAENFRIFGSMPRKDGDTDASLCLEFGPATNVLVGENDSGKTAIIDAIRLCLLTCGTRRRSCARAGDRGCRRSSPATRPCAPRARTTSTRRVTAPAPWSESCAARNTTSATTMR
ncbi:AAA family ATPase [Streptomyces sp. A012304]|uniref:AAA family ATPase n=1 Tax=Streptomyces sp. A012304 TaxID=375446 RepID=UPI0035D4E27F